MVALGAAQAADPAITALAVGVTDAQNRETTTTNGPSKQRAKKGERNSARKVGSTFGNKVGQQVGSKIDQVLERDRCAAGNYPAPEPLRPLKQTAMTRSIAPHVRDLDVA